MKAFSLQVLNDLFGKLNFFLLGCSFILGGNVWNLIAIHRICWMTESFSWRNPTQDGIGWGSAAEVFKLSCRLRGSQSPSPSPPSPQPHFSVLIGIEIPSRQVLKQSSPKLPSFLPSHHVGVQQVIVNQGHHSFPLMGGITLFQGTPIIYSALWWRIANFPLVIGEIKTVLPNVLLEEPSHNVKISGWAHPKLIKKLAHTIIWWHFQPGGSLPCLKVPQTHFSFAYCAFSIVQSIEDLLGMLLDNLVAHLNHLFFHLVKQIANHDHVCWKGEPLCSPTVSPVWDVTMSNRAFYNILIQTLKIGLSWQATSTSQPTLLLVKKKKVQPAISISLCPSPMSFLLGAQQQHQGLRQERNCSTFQ